MNYRKKLPVVDQEYKWGDEKHREKPVEVEPTKEEEVESNEEQED